MEIFTKAVTEELRPGRPLKVLHCRGTSGRLAARILFCHGSMSSMTQYAANIKYAVDRGDVDVLAYDWLGCGESDKPEDWTAYSRAELMGDLRAAYERLVGEAADGVPVILVAHSYGTSLAIQLAADFAVAHEKSTIPAALFLMSAATGDAAGKAMGVVFHMPVFALRWLQPTMSNAFAKMALHPNTDEAIKMQSQSVSKNNEMHVCKAFYRQMQFPWVQPDVLRAASGVPALFLHGDSDGLSPVQEAQLLAEHFSRKVFRVVGPASHQVMMEQSAATNVLLGKLIDNGGAGLDVLTGIAELQLSSTSAL